MSVLYSGGIALCGGPLLLCKPAIFEGDKKRSVQYNESSADVNMYQLHTEGGTDDAAHKFI